MAHLEGVLLNLVTLLLDPLAVHPCVLVQLLIYGRLARPPPLGQQLQHGHNVLARSNSSRLRHQSNTSIANMRQHCQLCKPVPNRQVSMTLETTTAMVGIMIVVMMVMF